MQTKTVELFEEMDWFKNAGVSASLTVRVLGRKWQSVGRVCRLNGRTDLAEWVRRDYYGDRWATVVAGRG